MATEPPGDTVVQQPGPVSNVMADLVLGVVNWWCLQHGKAEVMNLVVRHFEMEEIYKSHLLLAEDCELPRKPGKHNASVSRPALDAYANDLVTNMFHLVNDSKVPVIVIPATELGKIPLGAISVDNERSVSVRLETLENSVKSVVSTIEKLVKSGQQQQSKPVLASVFPDLTVSFSDPKDSGPKSYSI